jgi:hypothetical protein
MEWQALFLICESAMAMDPAEWPRTIGTIDNKYFSGPSKKHMAEVSRKISTLD